MHILYLHQYYCPEGGWGNDRSADFARRWVAAGHRVTVCTTTAYFPPDHPAHKQRRWMGEEHGVTLHVYHIRYAQRMGYVQRAWAFMQFFITLLTQQNLHADVLYVSTTPPTVALAGAVMAARWQRPWMLEVVDVWPEVPVGMGLLRFGPIIWALKWVMRFCYRSARHIVALSEGMKTQIMQNGVPASKISVIENGTQVERFRRRSTEHPAGQVRLIYTGAMGRANGLHQLIEATDLLRQTETNFHLTLVGGGSEVDALTSEIRRRKIMQWVTVKPPVPKEEVPAILSSAEVGIVCFAPYAVLEANSANKFFDYLASGLPVVINYGGWQASVLRDAACGFSSNAGDNIALVANLKELLQHAALRQEMGERARELAVAKYDRANLSARVLTLLQSIQL